MELKEIVEFLDEHVDLLEDNDFKKLSDYIIGSTRLSREDAEIFYFIYNELGIDFLKYMNYVPNHSFAGTPIPKITIPPSVQTIEDWAFTECEELTNVIIPNSVTEIGVNAFAYCPSLKSIEIPSGVEVVRESTFQDCQGLRDVTLCEGLKEIGTYAFAECGIEELIIPKTVKDIRNSAFRNNEQLKKITFLGRPTLYEDCFANCMSLKEIVLVNQGSMFFLRGFEDIFTDCSINTITAPESEKVNGKVLRSIFGEKWKKINFNWV